ncbi:MAG: hypothetical protein WBI06_05750 [Paludibacter sp.]
MTKPTVATKGSNSDSVGNRSSSFLLPESELRHPALLPVKQDRPIALIGQTMLWNR